MKDFFEMLACLMFLAAIAGTVFVFQGTPDLWDKWHEQAMAAAARKQ